MTEKWNSKHDGKKTWETEEKVSYETTLGLENLYDEGESDREEEQQVQNNTPRQKKHILCSSTSD